MGFGGIKMKKKYGKSCTDRQIEKCFDWNKLHNPYSVDANCDYLIYYGRMTKIDLNKGKKHKTCPVCGKGFYRKGANNKKYCSEECYQVSNEKRSKHYKSLGTPATADVNLNDSESIHKEVERIRKGCKKPVYNGESFYEIEIKNYTYRIE